MLGNGSGEERKEDRRRGGSVSIVRIATDGVQSLPNTRVRSASHAWYAFTCCIAAGLGQELNVQ